MCTLCAVSTFLALIMLFCFTAAALATVPTAPSYPLLSWPEYSDVANSTREKQACNKVDPAWNRNTEELSAAYKCGYIFTAAMLYLHRGSWKLNSYLWPKENEHTDGINYGKVIWQKSNKGGSSHLRIREVCNWPKALRASWTISRLSINCTETNTVQVKLQTFCHRATKSRCRPDTDGLKTVGSAWRIRLAQGAGLFGNFQKLTQFVIYLSKHVLSLRQSRIWNSCRHRVYKHEAKNFDLTKEEEKKASEVTKCDTMRLFFLFCCMSPPNESAVE